MTPETALLVELDLIPGQPDRWQDQALCAEVDPELHFPEKGGTTLPAKRICAACDVKAECLQYALDRDERFGIWGGTVRAGTPPAESWPRATPAHRRRAPINTPETAHRTAAGRQAREHRQSTRSESSETGRLMTPDDAVLTYTATQGWHLISLLELGYGPDLDLAVSLADQAETLCAHDRGFVTILRAGGWTDTAIADALQVPASALPTPAAVNLLDDLTRVAQRVSA